METHDIRLRRLRMRSWRRGTKEMDLILGGFADRCLAGLTAGELDRHEALMEEADQDLYAWISGATPLPAQHREAIARVHAHLSETSFQLPGKTSSV